MERFQRLLRVSDAYNLAKSMSSSHHPEMSTKDVLDYIDSIKTYLMRLHADLLCILEQA